MASKHAEKTILYLACKKLSDHSIVLLSLPVTTRQSMTNDILSQQTFGPCHEIEYAGEDDFTLAFILLIRRNLVTGFLVNLKHSLV